MITLATISPGPSLHDTGLTEATDADPDSVSVFLPKISGLHIVVTRRYISTSVC